VQPRGFAPKKIERSSIFYKSFEGLGKLFQKFPKKYFKNLKQVIL